MIYPSSYGWSAGLNAYSLSADIDNMYTSRALSDHAIGLHLGSTEKIVAMSNAGMILQKCILDDQLYVMEWYKEPGTPIGGDVPSWSNWYFQWGTKILDMRERGNHWVDMVVTAPAGGPAQDVGKVHLVRMDMQNNRQFYQEYGDVHLDLRGFTTSNGVNLSLPEDYPEHTGPDGLDNLVIVEKATGRTVPYTRSGRTYQFGFEPKDGQVYFGYPFESAVVLPSVVTRDESNVVQTQANMRISRYEVTLTGHAQATFSYKWGG
ncbi:MAG: hypothetical protein GY899_18290, partial [Verrucomicrobiaceae bacterium]|nr:hypothetical protein [Verrucomicrobiaceae bacterium]